jgi:hypothetical protein
LFFQASGLACLSFIPLFFFEEPENVRMEHRMISAATQCWLGHGMGFFVGFLGVGNQGNQQALDSHWLPFLDFGVHTPMSAEGLSFFFIFFFYFGRTRARVHLA